MRLARQLGVIAAVGATPVLRLAHSAARETWVQPISPTTGLYFWGLLTLPAMVVLLALRRTRLGADRAFSLMAWLLFASTHWFAARSWLLNRLDIQELTSLHLTAGLILLGLIVWAGARWDKVGMVAAILGVSFFAVQAFNLARDLPQLVEPASEIPAASTTIDPSTPSIWVFILDAHPSPMALREFYSIDLSPEVSALTDKGFRVWDDARSNYSHTTASVPSMLGGVIFPSPLDDVMPTLVAGLQGGTALTHSFSDAGYEVRMSPAPWSRSSCGPLIVECHDVVRDERLYFLLRLTPLSDLFPEKFGQPMPTDGRLVLESTHDFDSVADHFTIIHSTSSHLPFVLDEDCEVRAVERQMEQQFRCTQHLLLDALDAIDLATDIVIVMADHGQNYLGQGKLHPEEWTNRMVRERLSVFLAVSDPSGCASELPEQISNVQVLPLVLNCHGNDLPVPEARFVGMGQGKWGHFIEYSYPWDGWSRSFDD